MKEYYSNGLTNEEVLERIEKNQVNYDSTVKTNSISTIIASNLFNLFNFLNFGLALLILLVDSYKNLLFIGIVICNTIISTVQAIRSKIIVDKLAIINTNDVEVLRNGKKTLVNINEIVLDDLILYKPGNQIITDAVVLEGNVLVNEAFITGESKLVSYDKNDTLKSGSFIVSGRCRAKVLHVGEANYTSVITKGTKYVKKANSIILKSLNKIIKVVSISIIPMGLLLFYNQYNLDNNISQAILNTVAALIGMIPEGLILLTSTVLAVSVIRLSRLNVLVQELFCIEMLARVDTICLDKTGTLTTGKIKVEKIIPLNNKYNVNEIMGNIVDKLDNDNTTMNALNEYFSNKKNYNFIKKIPFSPVYKYSGISFKEGNFVIGAPSFVYKNKIKEVTENQKNYRVLLLCFTDNFDDMNTVPIGVILLKDEIRKSSKETLKYLKEQDVDIKIISGDNVNTLKGIALKVGLNNVKEIDLSNVELTEEIALNYNVFGRVSPDQKKLMVELLQKNKHVVAMTGDGVNDVLALKQADCSITVKEATEAARNVSQLVLLDSTFDSIPKIVEEGRRSINNIERSATLFLSKTIYSFLLALVFIFIHFSYPFQPIQLTLTNFFTIGVPSFVLALEPNKKRIQGNFLANVFSRSAPSALTIVFNIIVISIVGNLFNISSTQISTLSVIMTGFTGFLLLIRLSYPFNRLRLSLVISLIISFIITLIGLKNFFALTILNPRMLVLMAALVTLSTIIFNFLTEIINKFVLKNQKLFN